MLIKGGNNAGMFGKTEILVYKNRFNSIISPRGGKIAITGLDAVSGSIEGAFGFFDHLL